MLIVPDFTTLAGPVDRLMLEAHRVWRFAGPRTGGVAAAQQVLIGAADSAAREAALRWLENQIASTLAVHAMVEGKRDDADDTRVWDADAANTLAVVFAPLVDPIENSKAPRDPDWPLITDLMHHLCDPTLRGQATRLLRDMWWMVMQYDQLDARKKPGRFLASVGMVQKHIDEILAEEVPIEGGAPLPPLPLPPPPPVQYSTPQAAEHFGAPPPPVPVASPDSPLAEPLAALPSLDSRPPPLPGAIQLPPSHDEVKLALQRLVGIGIGTGAQGDLWTPLGISRSTLGNWGRGVIAKPKVTPEQAQLLRAECTRLIGELSAAEETFARIVR